MERKVINCQTGEVTFESLSPEELEERYVWERDVLPEEQLALLREKRDNLLRETDYLALADVTLTDEMRAYRQALRDLPANTEDPANPIWPIKPE